MSEGCFFVLTIGLLAESLADLALLLQVQVPALGLAAVLDGEGVRGLGVVDGLLAGGLVVGENAVDGVESLGGWELGCETALAKCCRIDAALLIALGHPPH